MNRIELEQVLLDELATVVGTVLPDDADAYEHVGITNRGTEIRSPALTFELFDRDDGVGMQGNPHIESVTVDGDAGEVQMVLGEHRRSVVDINASAAADDQRRVSALYDAVLEHMGRYRADHPADATLHPDVDHGDISIGNTQRNVRADDFLRAERLRIEVPYVRESTVTLPLIEEIDSEVGAEESPLTYYEWIVDDN